jgi:hypothetical protein
MPGKSTLQAVGQLLAEVRDSLSQLKRCLYGLFIDYTKAFDCLDRRKLIQKLELMLRKHDCLVALIRDILDHTYIRVSDGLTLSDTIMQTNGVMADMKRTVSFQGVTLLMYADNMALRSSNPEDLLLTV